MKTEKIDDAFLPFLRRAMQSVGVEQELIDQVIPEVQREWAGECAYIPVNGEDVVQLRRRRDDAIRRDHRNGERVSLLVRRYHLSRQRIYQIISDV